MRLATNRVNSLPLSWACYRARVCAKLASRNCQMRKNFKTRMLDLIYQSSHYVSWQAVMSATNHSCLLTKSDFNAAFHQVADNLRMLGIVQTCRTKHNAMSAPPLDPTTLTIRSSSTTQIHAQITILLQDSFHPKNLHSIILGWRVSVPRILRWLSYQLEAHMAQLSFSWSLRKTRNQSSMSSWRKLVDVCQSRSEKRKTLA